MKFGIIGIGDIAQKAYLPIVTTIEECDLILFSKDEQKLKNIQKKYKAVDYVTDLLSLSQQVDAVFIHAATEAHFNYCNYFLDKGIPVYVDKPISYRLHEIKQLFELAESRNVLFRTGFNRRHVPMISSLHAEGTPDMLIYQKNRLYLPNDIRTFIFDDFIHVVDTLRFLINAPIDKVSASGQFAEGKLLSVMLRFNSEKTMAVGIMNRNSGRNEEVIEVFMDGKKHIIENLNTKKELSMNREKIYQFNDWLPVLHRRGFENIIETFLNELQDGKHFRPQDLDSLKTHEICEEIVTQLESKARELHQL